MNAVALFDTLVKPEAEATLTTVEGEPLAAAMNGGTLVPADAGGRHRDGHDRGRDAVERRHPVVATVPIP